MKAKKLLSAILAGAMVLSTMSTAAFAEDTTANGTDASQETAVQSLISVSNQDGLNEAINKAGSDTTTTITLANGNYTLPTISNKSIALIGSSKTVIDMTAAVNASGSTVEFYTLTAVFDNDNYEGLQHSKKVTYDHCTIKGTQFLYADEVVFKNCTFEKYDNATEYNVWTYGAKDVTFDNCVFNSTGKAILVYTEAAHRADITLTDCKFYSNGTHTDKAAVEVGQSADGAESTYNVSFTNCTTDENFTANNSNSPLFGNKNNMTGEGLNVTVDDKNAAVATVNGVGYYSLQDALNDADKISTEQEIDVTVEILTDIELTKAWKPVVIHGYQGAQKITINGNNKKISGLDNMLFASMFAGKAELIINDLTITDSNIVDDEGAYTSTGYAAFIGYIDAVPNVELNNCHLTNSTVKGGKWTGGLIGYSTGYNNLNDGPVFTHINVTDCSVVNCKIEGAIGSVGGVFGHASGNAWTSVKLSDSLVEGNTITAHDENIRVGAIVGTLGNGGASNATYPDGEQAGHWLSATVKDNDVVMNIYTDESCSVLKEKVEVTTVYGRQGSSGILEVTGGAYEYEPIKEEDTFASYINDGFAFKNDDGMYVIATQPLTTEIKVKLEKVTDAEYNIVLDAGETLINRMSTADLTVAFESNAANRAPMTYSITPNTGAKIALAESVDASDVAYHFYYNGEKDTNGKPTPDSKAVNKIVLGKVTFGGFGKYTFSVTDAQVNTAEIKDNIVTDFVVAPQEGQGTIVIDSSAVLDATIEPEKKTLTINVDFNNKLAAGQTEAYQNMLVEIDGADGTDFEKALVSQDGKTAQVIVENILVANEVYTVTVSGAGYRTAKYMVTMTEDKELTFWNNVKDKAVAIENGKRVMLSNFLAGEIVKDNNINIYDLSAVVSYFGEKDITADSDYVKYDLNRDGMIDSKDVAYVLVSWGN